MQDTREKKAINKIIDEEIERINKTIPIQTNGFVKTFDTRDEPIFMGIKLFPSGIQVTPNYNKNKTPAFIARGCFDSFKFS